METIYNKDSPITFDGRDLNCELYMIDSSTITYDVKSFSTKGDTLLTKVIIHSITCRFTEKIYGMIDDGQRVNIKFSYKGEKVSLYMCANEVMDCYTVYFTC